MRYKILSLKKLLENFYIDEISKAKNIESKDINYINSEEIYINKNKISKDSKKECFHLAENRVEKYLSTFSCHRNKDVENFLHINSIRMQKENISRTYLIIDEENGNIIAYFALSIKPIIIREEHKISANKKNKMKINVSNGYDDEVFYSFLIGQIGRDDKYNRKIIRLEEIIDYILDIIDEVKSLIGGKIILIEVLEDENSEKLIKRYEEVGFTSIGIINDLTQLMTFSKNY
ncbi:hypothetical protein [Haliovirga abyssi]|uniref:Uncharacterized protein n=1 Tax=Haliovirga abyssi TaxID=2996794 RepID=A0AAU9DIZ8_9FUSO|nr:hypothetical protein [Haliovirga abyssi]BDU50744.1 hypothetical protein HLVA_13130 [Haliovirga abyssi]